MTLRTLDSLGALKGKRVIVRCDFNVPLDGVEIGDDGRIRASVPTIEALMAMGARVIAVSHLGRPEGKPDLQYSLRPVAARLGELLGVPVGFASDTVGLEAHAIVDNLEDGSVAVLENLRFDGRETAKDANQRMAFAEELASLGDALVSDGFGVVHRRQASVFELAELLPSAAGLLVQRELEVLEKLTVSPDRPFTVVLGGSKVSDKLGVIGALLPRVDNLLIGGGMAFTFLAALGYEVGASLLEADQIDTVKGYLRQADDLGIRIGLPTDIVVASAFADDAERVVTSAAAIEESGFGNKGIGLDIGPDTARDFARIISLSKTVFWNGPMGVFEMTAFVNGTQVVASAIADFGGFGVIGGGDSASAVRSLEFADDRFGHISTGGGASLEYLEGKNLPGLEVLGWQ